MLLRMTLTLLVVLANATALSAQSQLEKSKKGSQNIYHADPAKRDPLKKRDYVLIVINERAQAGVDADLQADRKTEYSLLLDKFLQFKGLNLAPDLGPQPEIEVEAEVKTKGKGKVKRNDRLDARVQAKVIDVRDNGSVVLEARTERTVGSERTVLTLSGEAPSNAIKMAADGTFSVTSDRLADLKIIYSGNGPVSGKTRATWLTSIVDWIWPF